MASYSQRALAMEAGVRGIRLHVFATSAEVKAAAKRHEEIARAKK